MSKPRIKRVGTVPGKIRMDNGAQTKMMEMTEKKKEGVREGGDSAVESLVK